MSMRQTPQRKKIILHVIGRVGGCGSNFTSSSLGISLELKRSQVASVAAHFERWMKIIKGCLHYTAPSGRWERCQARCVQVTKYPQKNKSCWTSPQNMSCQTQFLQGRAPRGVDGTFWRFHLPLGGCESEAGSNRLLVSNVHPAFSWHCSSLRSNRGSPHQKLTLCSSCS